MSAEHPNDIPGEYERSLLAALLEQAEREAREAGRKFSPAERQRITDEFIVEHGSAGAELAKARRSALVSRKLRQTREQKQTDFHWKPPAPFRRTGGR